MLDEGVCGTIEELVERVDQDERGAIIWMRGWRRARTEGRT
jgi:hypothetical protein